MKNDPYQNKLFKKNPYVTKRKIKGRIVAVLDGKLDNRGLILINPISRAVLRGQIHEFIVTDEIDSKPGQKVNSIGYIGFGEIENGGVVVLGDSVRIGGKEVGTIAGFDLTHAPNHLNIILHRSTRVTGQELGIKLEDEIEIF